MMQFGIPITRATRTTWRSDVREIAKALGIPVSPDQWVILEDGDGDGELPLDGTVDVVVWQQHPPAEYHVPELVARDRA